MRQTFLPPNNSLCKQNANLVHTKFEVVQIKFLCVLKGSNLCTQNSIFCTQNSNFCKQNAYICPHVGDLLPQSTKFVRAKYTFIPNFCSHHKWADKSSSFSLQNFPSFCASVFFILKLELRGDRTFLLIDSFSIYYLLEICDFCRVWS